MYAELLPVLEKFKSLTTCGMYVVFVCHCDEFYDTDMAMKAYKLLLPPVLNKWTTGLGFTNFTLVPQGNGPARLRCTTHPAYPSGDGTGRLPDWVPATFNGINAAYKHGDVEVEENQPQYQIWTAPARVVAKKRSAYNP